MIQTAEKNHSQSPAKKQESLEENSNTELEMRIGSVKEINLEIANNETRNGNLNRVIRPNTTNANRRRKHLAQQSAERI